MNLYRSSNMSLEDFVIDSSTEDTPTADKSWDKFTSQIALYMAVSLMAVIMVVGCIGNVMVILAVRTTKKLQTASNAFVVNLSVCDLLFVVIILPFNIYTYLNDAWYLPTFLCKAIGFMGYTLTGTTIITITLIAWNRYKLVVDVRGYSRVFSGWPLRLMLVMAWVAPALCLLPALLEVWGSFGYVTMLVTCNLLLDHKSQSFKLFLLIVRAAIPCLLILFYYFSIWRATKASHRRVRLHRSVVLSDGCLDQMIQRKEMHLTKMMAAIFGVFFFSYFPCTVSSIIDWNTVLSKRFHMFCLITVYIGSAVNPLIYGLMNSQFRTAYCSILLCGCCSGADELKGKVSATNSPATPKRSSSLRRSLINRKGNQTSKPTFGISSPFNKLSVPKQSVVLTRYTKTSAEIPESIVWQSLSPSTEDHRPLFPESESTETPTPFSSPELSIKIMHRSETEKTYMDLEDDQNPEFHNYNKL